MWIDDAELNRVCRSVHDLWREYVYEAHIRRFASKGYEKRQEAGHARANGETLDPFLIDIDTRQYFSSFRAALREMNGHRPPFRTENVVAAAFAGYFGAWRNCQTASPQKVWNVAHAVRHATSQNYLASCERFFRSMPHGKIITILRDPIGWAASYKKYTKAPNLAVVVAFYEHYLNDLEQVIDKAHPEKYDVISFTDIIDDTPGAMRRVADFLGIPFHCCMIEPSHNAAPSRAANTVFPDQMVMGGVDKSVLSRQAMLTPDETRIITERLMPIHLAVMEKAGRLVSARLERSPSGKSIST